MAQQQSEFFTVRPAGPAIWGLIGCRIDGPDVGIFSAFVARNLTPEEDLQPSGD